MPSFDYPTEEYQDTNRENPQHSKQDCPWIASRRPTVQPQGLLQEAHRMLYLHHQRLKGAVCFLWVAHRPREASAYRRSKRQREYWASWQLRRDRWLRRISRSTLGHLLLRLLLRYTLNTFLYCYEFQRRCSALRYHRTR